MDSLRAAWIAFVKYKVVFASRSYPFHLKAKLFASVVTPVVLYGAAAWTLTRNMEANLHRARRKMLRAMLCARKAEDEDWVHFVQRTTASSEKLMEELGQESWVAGYRRQKWRFIGKTALATDSRWPKRLLNWRPFFRCIPWRCVGRPCTRWEDCLTELVGDDWAQAAADEQLWGVLEHAFAHHASK